MPDEPRGGRRSARAAIALSAGSAMLVVVAMAPAQAEPPTRLADRAVGVISAIRPIGRLACESRGTGLAVGGGLVLTAAHVLLDRSDVAQGCKLPPWARARFRTRSGAPFALRVAAGGRQAAATLVATGERGVAANHLMSFAASSDYAILRVGPASSGEALRPCEGMPAPNRPVVVVLPGQRVETRVAAVQTEKSGDDAAYVDLDRVFDQGSSGAGVLDAETLCVWGVISHRFPEPAP